MKAVLSIFILLLSTAYVSAQSLKPVSEQSEVKFTIKNFGLNVNGSLTGLSGTLQFNPSNLQASSFNVSVNVSTVNTGVDMRDNHLKREEYFDVSKYPAITFVSTGITGDQNGYTVSGRLTIKDVTKNISFPFTATPQNKGTVFSGSFSIDRKDFHVGGSSAVLGSNVDVNLKVFAQ